MRPQSSHTAKNGIDYDFRKTCDNSDYMLSVSWTCRCKFLRNLKISFLKSQLARQQEGHTAQLSSNVLFWGNPAQHGVSPEWVC